jgi:hypothetical protein
VTFEEGIMHPSNKYKYEVILQPFNKRLGDGWVEFACPHCGGTVKATSKVQDQLSVGRVGHKCYGCETYFAFIQCPCCKETSVLDDKEWDDLIKPDGFDCPTCKATLVRDKARWRSTFMCEVSLSPSLSLWSSTDIEKKYIARIRKGSSIDKQRRIALRHHSVGAASA